MPKTTLVVHHKCNKLYPLFLQIKIGVSVFSYCKDLKLEVLKDFSSSMAICTSNLN